MKPFYCRVGSKNLSSKDIVKLIPKHETYIEPFVGGGAVYWRKEPSETEVINDLDKDLVHDYRLIQRAPVGLEHYRKDLNSIKKLKFFISKKNITVADKLTEAVIRRCNGFSSVYINNNKVYHNSNPYRKLKNIKSYKDRIKKTKILSQDYKKVISSYDGPTAFFFLDPPYEESKTVYKHSGMDFIEFSKILKNMKGHFILTLNDSPHIRRLFKWAYIYTFDRRTVGHNNIGTKLKKEVIILNYKP
tara:strand:+ start:54 stop:791 length:738 start_codon:yes stop_codon:yes gene_type:complete